MNFQQLLQLPVFLRIYILFCFNSLSAVNYVYNINYSSDDTFNLIFTVLIMTMFFILFITLLFGDQSSGQCYLGGNNQPVKYNFVVGRYFNKNFIK
jgi:hypothetical protein